MRTLAICISLTAYSAMAWSQAAGTSMLPDDEAGRCLYGANHMIDIARQAVADPRSRPDRAEARQLLVDDWTARLDSGEDPCHVYEDIHRSATTF